MPVSPPATGNVVDMTPLIDLITSTVARGTWTVNDGRGQALAPDGRPIEFPPPNVLARHAEQPALGSDGRPIELRAGSAPSDARTVGQITPFFLSISLIIRHTKEGHDEVANLLRNLRRLLDSREHPGGVEGYDRDVKEAQKSRAISPASAPKPGPPTSASGPDRTDRIRRLLDELRQEVEKLPKGYD